MSIIVRAREQLNGLTGLLKRLSEDEYAFVANMPHAPTIGRHIRHIIEHYQQLLVGARTGVFSYEDRQRDLVLEMKPRLAIQVIKTIEEQFFCIDIALDQPLLLHTDCDKIKTNFARELDYLFNHTIHHLAMVNVILASLGNCLQDESDVHPATLRFKHSCAL